MSEYDFQKRRQVLISSSRKFIYTWRLLQRRPKPGQPSTIWCWMGTRPRRWWFTLAALVQTLPLYWLTTLLWNRSLASNFSGAPSTTSSRGKIMLTASTPRPAGGCTFCAYSEGLGLSHTSIVRVFTSAVRSTLEYACATWHTCLTGQQSEKIESIQRRAMCIVAPDLSYRQALANFGLPTLKERRERLARDFFIKIVRNPDHKLRHLLPHERTIKYGLRTAKPDQNPTYNTAGTKRTLIPYGIIAHWI